MLMIIGIAIVALVALLYICSPLIAPKKLDINKKHVLVTGGSSGIGQAIALEATKRGAHVTLLARDQGRLATTKSLCEKVLKHRDSQKVLCISVDLTRDYEAVVGAVRQAEEMAGPVDVLINCAGYSLSGEFTELEPSDFKAMMNVNYLGSVYASKAVATGMKERKQGRIVFTSSQAGQVGLFGFTAYSASKFALRGLAESLQMELKPYNVRVTISFPPDTDTPGLQHENESKPLETRLISETAGLFQPEFVARNMLDDAQAGRFVSYLGLDGWMLANLTSGMSPITSLMEAVQQALLMGLFRIIAVFYLFSFDGIVEKCRKTREKIDKKL